VSGGSGARRTTLADVAARAGVSRATASRALAHDHRISPATRAAVHAAAEALEYVPNAAARSLRARRTRILGLLLPDLGDPVHGQVAAGFELEAAEHGYTVVFVAGFNVPAAERRALTLFTEHGTDGVVIVSSVLEPREAVSRSRTVPLVMVQPDHRGVLGDPGRLPAGTIRFDDASGVTQAIRHLVERGYRDVAYLGAGAGVSNSLRLRAAETALREVADLPLQACAVAADAWRAPAGLRAALPGRLPEAVLCYDDKLALALLDGLRQEGLGVPHDIAVVGIDDIPFATLSNPRLTTIATPTHQMGRRAARVLARAIVGEALPPPRTLPVELVVRESTMSAGPADTAADAATRALLVKAGER
jgi:DNA-binding LacI/PurR family transcriptional regulator